MSPRVRIILWVILSLFILGLGSCSAILTGRWTAVNLGGALENVGMEHPHKQKMKAADGQWAYPRRVWRKENRYIVEVPIAFVPLHPPVIEHNAGHRGNRNTLENRYWGPAEKEIAAHPTELYYAELWPHQYRTICKRYKLRPSIPNLKLIPAAEADFTGATLIYAGHGSTTSVDLREEGEGLPRFGNISTRSIPPRRTERNRQLQPLCRVLDIIDIPLTIIATPIGWVCDAIYEPLHN